MVPHTPEPPPTLTAIAGAVLGLSRDIVSTPARERVETMAHEALRKSLLDEPRTAVEQLVALQRMVVDRELAGLAGSDHERLVASLEPLGYYVPQVDSERGARP